MPLISSVGRFLTAANNKADQLTAGAKIALCLPSFLTSLPKSLIGGVISNISATLENLVSSASNIVLDTINKSIQQITGSITGTINSVTRVLGQVGSAIEEGKEFVNGLKERAKDIKEFTSNKQNCDFAAAQLMNCIVSQAIGSVTPKIAIDISKGLTPITNVANDVSQAIAAPGGAVTRAVNKTAGQIDRATRVIQKSNLF